MVLAEGYPVWRAIPALPDYIDYFGCPQKVLIISKNFSNSFSLSSDIFLVKPFPSLLYSML